MRGRIPQGSARVHCCFLFVFVSKLQSVIVIAVKKPPTLAVGQTVCILPVKYLYQSGKEGHSLKKES